MFIISSLNSLELIQYNVHNIWFIPTQHTCIHSEIY